MARRSPVALGDQELFAGILAAADYVTRADLKRTVESCVVVSLLVWLSCVGQAWGFLKRIREAAFIKPRYPNRVRGPAASGTHLILTSYFFSGRGRGIPDLAGWNQET